MITKLNNLQQLVNKAIKDAKHHNKQLLINDANNLNNHNLIDDATVIHRYLAINNYSKIIAKLTDLYVGLNYLIFLFKNGNTNIKLIPK